MNTEEVLGSWNKQAEHLVVVVVVVVLVVVVVPFVSKSHEDTRPSSYIPYTSPE